MKGSFDEFSKKYGGKVFIIYSIDDRITNEEVISEIGIEIKRLSLLELESER
jgi:hypothetical protein